MARNVRDSRDGPADGGGVVLLALLTLALVACGGESETGGGDQARSGGAEAGITPLYEDVSATHLPEGVLDGLSMDAAAADLDGDGDADLVVANEFRPNILLLNDGSGRFTDASHRLPAEERDSEDVGIADFDGDGDLDVVVVSEDDRVNELYFNDGAANFTDEKERLPVEGVSNAVVVADISGDGAPDILIGNNGQNVVLVNDGSGHFVDETDTRLPERVDVTQDLELGDVDGDGDADLLVANEGPNVLLINDGSGRFELDREDRIPRRARRVGESRLEDEPEETREVDLGDVDGDGDLDVFFANVSAFVPGADPSNRLLVNNGRGGFLDESAARLPADAESTFDGDFFDLDGDGDLDILTSNSDVDLSEGRIAEAPYRALLNDGTGVFTASEELLPETMGTGFDAEFVDVNGDGRPDLYLAGRGTPDRLLLRR